jgi:hypothetical protein
MPENAETFLFKIFSEKLNYDTGPRIDHVNTDYKKNGGDVKVNFNLDYFFWFNDTKVQLS